MKRAFAVTLLLLSFASVALADGPGMPPTGSATKPPKPATVLLADGSGMPPVCEPGDDFWPCKGQPTADLKAVEVAALADGPGMPPTGSATKPPKPSIAA